MSEESEEMGKIFEVLSHRIRRGIIRILGEKGKRSFTDLMRDINIDDTGTLTFHLKKLVGFITKTPDGYYELTDLGLKAYNLLKTSQQLVLPNNVENVKREEEGASKETEYVKPDLIILQDRISLTIDRELLEKVKAMGKRLLITDVIKVEVSEDVDPKLFNEVVESIQDVVTLKVPKHLETLVHLKARDVLNIVSGKGTALIPPLTSVISSAIEAMTSVVTRMITSLAPRMHMKLSRGRELIYSGAIPSIKALALEVVGGYAKVYQGDSGRIEVYRRDSCDFDVEVKEGGELEVSLNGCEAHVALPSTKLEKVLTDVNGGVVEMEIPSGVNTLKLDVEGGMTRIRSEKLSETNISTDVNGGVVELQLRYTEFKGIARIATEMSGGLLKIEALVPQNTLVNVIQKGVGGYTDIEIDEKLKAVKQSERIAYIDLEIDGGYAKISFKTV